MAGGLLYVYDMFSGAVNVYNPATGAHIGTLNAAKGHWSSPIVIGGRVILPTGGSTNDNASSSTVYIFHLPGR